MDLIRQEFEKKLLGGMQDGTFSFTYKYNSANEDEKAYIYYTPEAFTKTLALITAYDSEVAWHCLARRLDDGPNMFEIYDVLVYKQHVTGSTVNTDQNEYVDFLGQLSDDEIINMRAQCHSHVNMATSPSPTDLEHQRKMIEMYGHDGFYIFQIWNKRLDTHSYIYDLENNVFFEDKDVIWTVEDSVWENIEKFKEYSKSLVIKNNVTTYPKVYSNTGNGSGYKAPESPKKSDAKEKWYMSGDQKEKDYDKEIFDKKSSAYDYNRRYWDDEWDSSYIYS
jgi:hypothetical protein